MIPQHKTLFLTMMFAFTSSLWAVHIMPKKEAYITATVLSTVAYILMLREQKQKERYETT